MSQSVYKLQRVALLQYVQGGATRPRHAVVPVIAKRNLKEEDRQEGKASPYYVANEEVSACLADMLGLPIPAHGIGMSGEEPYFFTANFKIDRPHNEHLTPQNKPTNEANWQEVINKYTSISWGITLFDIWMINGDRAPINIAFDDDMQQFIMFDHGGSLFAGSTENSKRLKNNLSKIVAGRYPTDHKSSELQGKIKSPFFRFLRSFEGIEYWYKRINDLPDWQIQDATKRGLGIGYSEEKCNEVYKFLIKRRKQLFTMIDKHRELFPSLTGDSFQEIAANVSKEIC